MKDVFAGPRYLLQGFSLLGKTEVATLCDDAAAD